MKIERIELINITFMSIGFWENVNVEISFQKFIISKPLTI